jgi:periplasmic divalent cation tolerance protein
MDPVLLVLSNLPDRERALQLAAALVEARLAACVNVLGECTSVYRWRGAVETGAEVPVLIKTRESLYARLEDAIRGLHPYEVPEIIALRVTAGLPAYLQWVLEESRGD